VWYRTSDDDRSEQADHRDSAALSRDLDATQRDVDATERDRASQGRDRAVRHRMHTAGRFGSVSNDLPDSALGGDDLAVARRGYEQAVIDLEDMASQRDMFLAELHDLLAHVSQERGAARDDREASARDREAAQSDRRYAENDRRAAEADWQQREIEWNQVQR
jgi:hypothetical protein